MDQFGNGLSPILNESFQSIVTQRILREQLPGYFKSYFVLVL